jgi:hypothetical protein
MVDREEGEWAADLIETLSLTDEHRSFCSSRCHHVIPPWWGVVCTRVACLVSPGKLKSQYVSNARHTGLDAGVLPAAASTSLSHSTATAVRWKSTYMDLVHGITDPDLTVTMHGCAD